MGEPPPPAGKRKVRAGRRSSRGPRGRARVEIQLATAEEVGRCWRDHLSRGGVIGPDLDVELVRLVLRGPRGAPLELDGRAVHKLPTGAGYEVIEFRARHREIEAWVDACCADAGDEARTIATPRLRPPSRAPRPGDTVRTPPMFIDELTAPAVTPAVVVAPTAAPRPVVAVPRPPSAPAEPSVPLAKNALERVRRLALPDQLRLARTGERDDRIAVERILGKAAWEGLLRNPRITPPEVAAIARMGMLPGPLVELVVANQAWLRAPEVRRALLTNPRLGGDQVARVLRAMPKPELKLVATQAIYPASVRDVARRLLPGD